MKTRHILTREDVEKAVLIYCRADGFVDSEIRLAWKVVRDEKKDDDVVKGVDIELDVDKMRDRSLSEMPEDPEEVEVSMTELHEAEKDHHDAGPHAP